MPSPPARQSARRRPAPPASAPEKRGARWQRIAGTLAVALSVAAVACTLWRNAPERPAPVRVPEIVHVYPHDPQAFTQGLLCADGFFYESTGLEGQSSLRRVEIESGLVAQRTDVPAQYFAEGLAAVGNDLIQLTWRNQEAFVYDKATFEKKGGFQYRGEGWGLAYDGRRLILSDGTATLRFFDPATHAPTSATLRVTDAGRAVADLNELEVVEGDLLANVWKTGRIARISLRTGRVLEWLDLTELAQKVQRLTPDADVLNGIAYDPKTKRLFVTGKLWPNVYEIR